MKKEINNGSEEKLVPVISQSEIRDYNWDYIVVATQRYTEIREECVRLKLNESRIILHKPSIFSPDDALLFDIKSDISKRFLLYRQIYKLDEILEGS